MALETSTHRPPYLLDPEVSSPILQPWNNLLTCVCQVLSSHADNGAVQGLTRRLWDFLAALLIYFLLLYIPWLIAFFDEPCWCAPGALHRAVSLLYGAVIKAALAAPARWRARRGCRQSQLMGPAVCSAYLYSMSDVCHPDVPVAGHRQTTPWQVLFVLTNYVFLVRACGRLLPGMFRGGAQAHGNVPAGLAEPMHRAPAGRILARLECSQLVLCVL